MKGHTSRVWKIRQMNEKIVSCAEDTCVMVWDLNTGEHLKTLEGHQGKSVWAIAVDSKTEIIVSGGSDSGIKLWRLNEIKSSISFNSCEAFK
jgi:WD40 repeat protein